MIKTKAIEGGKVLVTSTTGMVDIGEGAVPAIICSPDEVEYITEVKDKKGRKE